MIVRRVVFVLLLLPLAVFAQTADQEIVLPITDSPDPAIPGQNITYTVTVRNNGPDPAVNGGINVYFPNLTYVSASGPAGFTCNALGQAASCTHPAFPSGSTAVITVVLNLPEYLLAFPDGTVTTSFSTSGVTVDPVPGNNGPYDVVTAYDTPQVDLALTVSDSPDPVFPNGNVTFTVDVTNNGPDAAPEVNFNVFNNGSLRFVSATLPAPWTCTLPAPNGTPAFSCNNDLWPSGTSYQFTVVLKADPAVLGINDGTVQTAFSVTSSGGLYQETNHANNEETESTQYVTPDADMNITATDSPDPVGPDGHITYTVTVTNQGPDAAPDARMTIVGNGGQTRFVSITVPAGWTCGTPAPGTLINATNYDCTIASLANGASAVFTVVTEASDDLHPNTDHNVTQAFVTSSTVADPDNTDNSVTVTTAFVVNDADMNITATDSPDPVNPDGDITYTVTVTNQGPDPATNAKMTIVANGGQTRFVSITAPAGWTCNTPAPGTLINATNYECTTPSLANGASAVFTVVTNASDDLHPNSDHNITQNFTTIANEADPDNTDNTAALTTLYVVPDADISVTNADAPDPVAPGGTITYTQTITNNGPDTATTVNFIQSTPPGTTFQSLVSPAGWSCVTPAVGATGGITCTKASMAPAEIGAFTLVVNVTGTGTITSTVSGGSNVADPDPTDNNASTTTTSIGPASADLSITKTTATTTAPAGSTFSYTITLTNNGPDAAANVVMSDPLPASLLFRSITTPAGFTCSTPAVGATGTITCNAATLANGAVATFTLTVQVAASSGPISNTATATSDTTDPNGGNSGSTSAGVTATPAQADIEITKTTAATTATTGGPLTYTITVTNAGPSPATNVVVTDTLPAGLTLVSATPSQGTCNAANPVTCNLGTIASGGSATIALATTVTATSGTISNTASVTSSEGDTDASTTAPIPVGSAVVAPIPTVSEWGLMMLALMLAVAAALKMRG